MNKKKQIFITSLLIITFVLSSTALASMAVIHEDNIKYDITPKEITTNSYMPLEQLEKEINNFDIEKLNNDKVLLMFKNYFYILATDEILVQSNNGDIHLDNPILKINDHILVPVEFLTDYLNIKIIAKNFRFPGKGKDDEDRDEDRDEQRHITANIYLDDNEYEEDEEIEVTIEIRNHSNREEVLEFNSGKIYEIYIKNSNGNIVYTWSKNKNFTQAFHKTKLSANGSKRYLEEIDLRGFRKGYYYIEAEIRENNIKIKTNIKRFYIDD